MSGRTTIVLGLGATGFSCIRHLAGRDRLLAFDTRPQPPFLAAVRERHPEVTLLGAGDWPRALASGDRLLVSPGVANDHCLVAAARAAGLAISSDIELFLESAPAPVVGITGTNGKSTVATLVGELMTASGIRAGVGGNLGRPALELLADDCDGYVLELSSFQLERLQRPGLAVAAVLNISADHLDRHAGLAAYAACKRRIYRGSARVVCNADDPRTLPEEGAALGRVLALNGHPDWRIDGDWLVIDGERVPSAALALGGRHNHFNVLAAAAIAHQAGVAATNRVETLTAFRGLPHRGETVAEIDGVTYINDSKATNVGACLAALEGFGSGASNLVLIAGGDAKGASFDALAGAVARHVCRLVLLGRDAVRLERALGAIVETRLAGDMGHAVRLARQGARPGDTVLLSPACASFDQYPDFQARGDDFAAAVRDLVPNAVPARD